MEGGKLMYSVLAVVVLGLAGGGWGAHTFVSEKLASKEDIAVHTQDIEVAGGKADYVLDRQMESVIKQISFLERKRDMTPSEVEQLRYLREQLKIMRQVRAGKK